MERPSAEVGPFLFGALLRPAGVAKCKIEVNWQSTLGDCWMTMNWKVAAMACLAVLLAVPAMAQDDGAATYKAKCQKCHGEDGMSHTFDGKMSGAAKLNAPEIVKMPDADLIAVVTNGKKHMPAFGKKLTADQIASVVAYVRTLQKPAAN
jgi:mono/diheme cytochrome c family protein